VLVASANDEYATPERSRAFAAAWGSKLVEIGNAGHINGDSGFGLVAGGRADAGRFLPPAAALICVRGRLVRAAGRSGR
jgi:predicted alpha/beta hydrolase family esterase